MIAYEKYAVDFEGRQYGAPAKKEAYLALLYGEKWQETPFFTKEELKKENEKNWFSRANCFHVTSLKHTRHVDLRQEVEI